MNFQNKVIFKICIVAFVALSIISCSLTKKEKMKKAISEYSVLKLKQPIPIDGNWDKPQWKSVETIYINNYMGDIPKFCPIAEAKMMYDENNIYVIFRVQDRYVRCISQDINGEVWDDAAVEFFFAPDSNLPLVYYNLEINCGGTPLMFYNIAPKENYKVLKEDEIKQIEIAHSLPKKIDPEITDPVTWTLEYRIPVGLLQNYSNVTIPEKDVIWKANFYKIATNNSNPHFITWSLINNPEPDFHLPQFFGTLRFQ